MKFIKLSALVVTGALLMSGCGSTVGTTAMQVGDTKISEGAVQFVAQYALGTTDAQSAADLVEQDFLLSEVASKLDITLTDDELSEIRSGIANFKSQVGGKKAGDKILKKFGIDDEVLETLLSASAYSQKVFEQVEVSDPTDEEMQQYFIDNYLRAKHVLISTKDSSTGDDVDDDKMAEAEKTANEVLEKAQSGEDFDELISEYNEDPGMESNPDGYVFTNGDMVSEFENATKSIQPGEFTLCKSDYGYHIIQRLSLDASTEGFAELFEDNQSAVESAAYSKKAQDALEKKAEELGITVNVNSDVIDGMVITFDEDE